MKKFIFYLSIIILSLIPINYVSATSEEDELKRILNLVPNEYNLNMSSSQKMTDLQTEYYLLSSITKTLDETEHESLTCSSINCYYDFTNIELFINIELKNERYRLTLSNGLYSASKEGEISINYVEPNLEDEKSVNDAINYIRSKTSQFSDFDFSHINYDFITNRQILKETESLYNVDFLNYANAGSTALTKDEQLEVSFHKDYIFIFKNSILYLVLENNVIVDTTVRIDGDFYNYYYSKISLNNYYNIEDYVDDVFIAFKKRTGYANCMIKETENGDRYKVTSTSNDSNSYEVIVVNLKDNTEWTIFFNGKLKEKEEIDEDLLGDMNRDGKITITDVIILLRKYLGLN